MNKLVQYLKDSKTELKKVVWPTKKETFNYTVAVIGISLAIAILVGVADYLLTIGAEQLIK